MNRKVSTGYWLFTFIVLLIIFGRQTGNFEYTFYFLTFFIPVAVVTSWYFNNVLLLRFIKDKKLSVFLIHSIFLVIISLDIQLIIVFLSFLLISIYDYQDLPAIIDNYKWLPVIMYFIVLLSAFINLINEFFNDQKLKSQGSESDSIEIRSERRNRKILLKEILYIESMSDYIIVVLLDGEKVISRIPISRIHLLLPENFLRIHRSYIVNKDSLNSYSKEEVIIGEKSLPVSRTYKKQAMEELTG